MPYLVKGNAEQLFNAFGQSWAVIERKDDTGIIQRDFSRTHFIGSNEQAIKHFNTWRQDALGTYYLQGNMSAGSLWCLLGCNPLMKVNEDPEMYQCNFVSQHFAYINDKGEPCGLMLIYRKDEPKQWMVGLVTNACAASKDRELTYLSSFDLTSFIKEPVSDITVSSVGLHENPLMQQIGSDLPSRLLQNVFNGDSGEINLRAQRIDFLMRTLNVEQQTAHLDDPISFNELNLPALFADNPALDLLVRYKTQDITLSFAMLKDLVFEPNGLRKELEAIKLSSDERVNKNLLKMLITFYEKGILEQNRKLLNDRNFVKTIAGFMWDKLQIKLIPFLLKKEYDLDLIHKILSEPAYFSALNQLVDLEPALTQDVPQFFKDAHKLEELAFIHSLTNKECKLLCLIFWVKGTLSLDGYQEIVDSTQKYPLLAATLIDLDQKKIIMIDGLRRLALNPHEHLKKSFLHHYTKELKGVHNSESKLRVLSLKELEAVGASLMLLKESRITESELYHRILENDHKGQALRLLLPQLAGIKNEVFKKTLIDILYTGVKQGIQTQGNKVKAIADPELLVLAKSLYERFVCLKQMQDLGFKNELIELAAQEEMQEAKHFRHIILRVEAQCKVISERLFNAPSSDKWRTEEENYRKNLYLIAFNGLMNPNENVRPKLEFAEQKILEIVDPKKEFDFLDALIILANIVITALSFTIANEIKYRSTGNYWFFTQTKSGEELRALDKEVAEQIELEKSNETRAFLPIAVY